MSITPYLIYQQEIPGEEVTQIWSGKDDRFSTFAPYESHQNKMDGLLPVPRFPEAPAPELPEKMDAPPLANPLSGSREPDVEREALPEEAVDFDLEEESVGQGAESEFLIEDPVPETSVETIFVPQPMQRYRKPISGRTRCRSVFTSTPTPGKSRPKQGPDSSPPCSMNALWCMRIYRKKGDTIGCLSAGIPVSELQRPRLKI
jgi:hypothetical protein